MRSKLLKMWTTLALSVCMVIAVISGIVFGVGADAPIDAMAADVQIYTLSFASADKRTAYSNSQQVWENDGITFTNNKCSSTTNVGDYYNPVRLYAKSEVTIKCTGMVKIEFACKTASYATALKNSFSSDVTSAMNSKTVTVTFLSAVDSFTINSLSGQVRLDSLTVTVSGGGESSSGESSSGESSSGESSSGCEHIEEIDKAVAATCTETGLTEGKHCRVCNTVLVAQEPVPIIDHTYVDGSCTMCGKAEPVLPFKVGDIVIFTGSKADGTVTQELTGFAAGATYGTATEYTDTPAGTFPITVVEGYQSGTYAFKNGDNYITCNGEKKVNLSTTRDEKSSWTIDFNADGTYKIKSCSTTTTNLYLQYNSGDPRFTTYKSNQRPIKFVQCPVVKGVALSLNKGITVKVKYDIPAAWLALNEGAKVVFSNGQSFAATAGANVYSVDLTPAQINDDLTVKIQRAGSDFGTPTDVSVSAYKTKVEAAYANGKLNYTKEKYDALIALLDAALTYANAADDTIAEDLENDFAGVGDFTIVHRDEAAKLFTGCAGTLSTYASVRIAVNTANISEGGDTLIIKAGTQELYNGDFAGGLNADNQIVIDGIYPLNFGDTISIEASDGSRATFTFNAYLKEVYSSTADQSVKNMAVATYLYGQAAEAFFVL